MTDAALEPNAMLFDITAALTGRGYPEVSVDFYLDEATALEISRLDKEMTRLAMLERIEEHDALDRRAKVLRESLRSQRYTYHLRGIPNKIRQDVLTKTFEKFPHEKDILGREEDNDERDNYYSTLLWHAMTVKIVAPNGAVQINPSIETIQQFRDFAPSAALEVINAGIQELTTGVKAGFEFVTQDTDFLSQP